MAEAGYPKNSNTFSGKHSTSFLCLKKKKNPNLQKIYSWHLQGKLFWPQGEKEAPKPILKSTIGLQSIFWHGRENTEAHWNTVCSSDKDINMEKVEQGATKW